jgi:hypothetical protein
MDFCVINEILIPENHSCFQVRIGKKKWVCSQAAFFISLPDPEHINIDERLPGKH